MSRSIKPLLCALGVVMLSGTAVEAAGSGDRDLVARGDKLAQLVCSVCHVVARDDKHVPLLPEPGPSFVDVAARPATTEASLRAYLATRHPDMGPAGQMPNPRLVDYEIDELVAYILSLRK
jgi:mono/diheme cytochrome c family protein